MTAVTLNWAPPSSLARSLSLHRARALFTLFLLCAESFASLGCVPCALSTPDCHVSSEDPLPLLCFSKTKIETKIFAKYPLSRFSAVLFPLSFSIQNKNLFFFVRVREIPERERERDTHTHTHRGRDRGDLFEWRIALPWGV